MISLEVHEELLENRMSRPLTTGQIAKYCGVNFRTVIRWIERGLLTAYQLPGRGDNRVEVADFLRFLHENSMPVPDDLIETSNRVLIVEDDANLARSFERVLKRNGFETVVALDGFSAGALLGTFAPAVMTLDLKMPGISGSEVLEFVKSTPRLAGVKILVVSAQEIEELEKTLRVGADDILQKPFENDVLVEKVRRLAGKGASVAQAG